MKITNLRGRWLDVAHLPHTQPLRSGKGTPTGSSVRVDSSISVAGHGGSELIFKALIVLAGIAAIWLRCRDLSSQSLWLDEGYTLWISRFSPREIWQVLRMDTSAPLYYVLIHHWSYCFGTSEFWLRALSAVFGTLSIPLYFLLASKILADRVAEALAMAIFAVNFLQVWYSQESRCYALLVFLSLGTIYCLLVYLENRDLVRFLGVVLFLVASLYTHNIALFYMPGLAVLWLAYPAERKFLARVKDGLLVCSVVLLLYLPWLPTLRSQMQRQMIHGNSWLAVAGIRDLLDSLCILSGLDPRTLQDVFRERFHSARLFGFWTWALTVLIIVLVCILGGLFAARTADRRKTAGIVAYSLSPMLLVFASSHISSSIFASRLFLGSCALLPVVLCAPIAFHVGSRRLVFELLACVVLLGVGVSAAGYLRRERKEDWRGAAEYLLKSAERPQLTIVVPDIGQPLMRYYVTGLFKSDPPGMDMTGLLTKYDPPDLDLERRTLELSDNRNTDPLALLSREMASEAYKEVDVVMQPSAPPELVKPMLGYLAMECSSVEAVEFHWLQMKRCSVRAMPRH
jgi:4-amino-4-deoxy-L-arabinose transferase-like glycosyltransferase